MQGERELVITAEMSPPPARPSQVDTSTYLTTCWPGGLPDIRNAKQTALSSHDKH
jgi:hypothetical protein